MAFTVFAAIVARLALGNIPVTPVVSGRPVPLPNVIVGFEDPRTTLPVPVTAVKAVPATRNVFGPAVSIVLFVNVSAVARPTKVSVPA